MVDKNIELIYKPRNLKKYIKKSKIAITACGSTVYEMVYYGKHPEI